MKAKDLMVGDVTKWYGTIEKIITDSPRGDKYFVVSEPMYPSFMLLTRALNKGMTVHRDGVQIHPKEAQ
jgi:hypothetical protein